VVWCRGEEKVLFGEGGAGIGEKTFVWQEEGEGPDGGKEKRYSPLSQRGIARFRGRQPGKGGGRGSRGIVSNGRGRERGSFSETQRMRGALHLEPTTDSIKEQTEDLLGREGNFPPYCKRYTVTRAALLRPAKGPGCRKVKTALLRSRGGKGIDSTITKTAGQNSRNAATTGEEVTPLYH